jgi:hypothetical protein
MLLSQSLERRPVIEIVINVPVDWPVAGVDGMKYICCTNQDT